jgi:hypothetical protein
MSLHEMIKMLLQHLEKHRRLVLDLKVFTCPKVSSSNKKEVT